MSVGLFCKSLNATFWYTDLIHIYVFYFHVGYQVDNIPLS